MNPNENSKKQSSKESKDDIEKGSSNENDDATSCNDNDVDQQERRKQHNQTPAAKESAEYARAFKEKNLQNVYTRHKAEHVKDGYAQKGSTKSTQGAKSFQGDVSREHINQKRTAGNPGTFDFVRRKESPAGNPGKRHSEESIDELPDEPASSHILQPVHSNQAFENRRPKIEHVGGAYAQKDSINSTQDAKTIQVIAAYGHSHNNQNRTAGNRGTSDFVRSYNEKNTIRDRLKESHTKNPGKVHNVDSIDEMPDEPASSHILQPVHSNQTFENSERSDDIQFRYQSRTSSTNFPSTYNVVATIVQDDEDKTTIPTVYPAEVMTEKSIKRKRHKLFLILGLLVCLLVGLVAALVVTQIGGSSDTATKDSPVENNTSEAGSKLERVNQRGSLKCGVVPKGDFLYGLSAQVCKGIAAAIFGNDDVGNRFELIESASILELLAKDEVDVSTYTWTHTMEREVYLATEKSGFSFTTPLFYTGLHFGGIPPYHECAATQNTQGECKNLKVCITSGTVFVDLVRDLFPEENILVIKSSPSGLFNFLGSSTCNVVGTSVMSKELVMLLGYKGEFELGNGEFSHDPFALVTRNDDPQWSDFVNWVVQAIITSEKHNITRDRAHELPTTHVFGDKFKNMFIDTVASIGNYAELYADHLGMLLPREGRNLINDGTSGRIYSHPFGSLLQDNALGQMKGGMLENITQRGYLICGVIQNDTSGGEILDPKDWTGIEVEYCRAISAAIFQNHTNRTKFISVHDDEAFIFLSRKDVDVLGLVKVNLENDVLEATTGKGYTFTEPIFYNSLKEPLALATRQDEAQWSSFVSWTVFLTFYAEEKNITEESSNEMPLSDLFGSQHKTMMRDVISAVGNYGDMFDNNIEQLGVRSGLNMINDNGPQFFPYPGIM